MRIQKFNNGRFFFAGGISRLNRKYGWYRGKRFTKWLGQLIARKTGNAEITFRELSARGYPALYVVSPISVLHFVLENLNRSLLTEADGARTVSISSSDIGPRVRKLREGEKSVLMKNGQHALTAFLQKNKLAGD